MMRLRLDQARVRLVRRGPRALTLAALAALVAPVLPASATPAPSLVAPACGWPQQVSADTRNIFLPDSAAYYWVTPFQVHRDLRIVISGEYPDSRYASFNVYAGTGGSFTTNGVGSGLSDHKIAPDPGSRNPWRSRRSDGGRFTVTLRADPAPGHVNTLPLAPEGTADGSTGYLIYRVYLPAGGTGASVPLPSLTFQQGGESRTLPTCPASTGAPAGTPEAGRAAAAAQAAPITFARPTEAQGNRAFPNADNAYLRAWVTPPGAGEVVVIRARAPRATRGNHPAPWPGLGKHMRYWSMCTNLQFPLLPVVVNPLPDGTVDYGCRHDDLTKRDRFGFYTYVIGTEAQRPAIERLPGVTFLPFSTAQPAAPHLVLLRNMLPVRHFRQAVQNVPKDENPASAAAVMGAYYPRAAVCSLQTLTARGHRGCF